VIGVIGNSKGLSLSWNYSCIISRRGFVYFPYQIKGQGLDCEIWHDDEHPNRLPSLKHIGLGAKTFPGDGGSHDSPTAWMPGVTTDSFLFVRS
jgi:hypothetical protein